MTYRKLSHSIITAATLVLGVAWYGSLHTYYSAYFGTPAGGCALDLERGTTGIFLYPPPGSWDLHFQSIADEDRAGEAPEWTSPWGRFEKGTFIDHDVPPRIVSRHVWLPVWLPYLLFTGAVLACGRILQGRSDAATEKKLAERVAADSLTSDPG